MNKGVRIKIDGVDPVSFCTLEEGDFFTTKESLGLAYQKTYLAWSDPNDSAKSYNAVKLNTGSPVHFKDTEKVHKLKGDLNFEYE